MELHLLERLNVLWCPIYPYLAEWAEQWCKTARGWILELGPFSGGISDAMVNRLEGVRPICLTSEREIITWIRSRFHGGIYCVRGAMEKLPFREGVVDMIISRGAFFFLTPRILRETYRVLAPGSRALLGGGYGPRTPRREIGKIARESRELNYRMGKRRISREKLEQIMRDAGLESSGEIIEEGGLWLLLHKKQDSGGVLLKGS